MTLHRLPDGTIIDLVPGATLTPEEGAALAAYLPLVKRNEAERRAEQTPRERANEKHAWRAAVRGPRGRG